MKVVSVFRFSRSSIFALLLAFVFLLSVSANAKEAKPGKDGKVPTPKATKTPVPKATKTPKPEATKTPVPKAIKTPAPKPEKEPVAKEPKGNAFGKGGITIPKKIRAYYDAVKLTSDNSTATIFNDPNLVNSWGISFFPDGYAWVANRGTGTASLYNGLGEPQVLSVEIPGADGGIGKPVGIVYNPTADFAVSSATLIAPASVMFAGADGTISGWNPDVSLNQAILQVNNSTANSMYTGIALSEKEGKNYLYAVDFRNGRIDVFDGALEPVKVPGGFVDRKMQRGFVPYNIQKILGYLYVTYARQNFAKTGVLTGPSQGMINVFDTNGYLVKRLVNRCQLNAPWGLALAPRGFGHLSHCLLVANTGDGTISAYDPWSGNYKGNIRGRYGRSLFIAGLKGISFGNGSNDFLPAQLYFSAGPNAGTHGLFGKIKASAYRIR